MAGCVTTTLLLACCVTTLWAIPSWYTAHDGVDRLRVLTEAELESLDTDLAVVWLQNRSRTDNHPGVLHFTRLMMQLTAQHYSSLPTAVFGVVDLPETSPFRTDNVNGMFGDILVIRHNRQVMYYGLRSPDVLISFIEKLRAAPVTLITDKVSRKDFERVEATKVVGYFEDTIAQAEQQGHNAADPCHTSDPDLCVLDPVQTKGLDQDVLDPGQTTDLAQDVSQEQGQKAKVPGLQAFLEAANEHAPDVPFYLVKNAAVANFMKMNRSGEIQLVKKLDKQTLVLPTNPASVEDIRTFLYDHVRAVLNKISPDKLHKWTMVPDVLHVLSFSSPNTPAGPTFYKVLKHVTRKFVNATNLQVNIINPEQFPMMCLGWEVEFGVDLSWPQLGLVNTTHSNSTWFDVPAMIALASSAEREAVMTAWFEHVMLGLIRVDGLEAAERPTEVVQMPEQEQTTQSDPSSKVDKDQASNPKKGRAGGEL